MYILEGANYKKFKCEGGVCSDSCCIGWKVSIDKETYNKYKKTKGNMAKVLIENIGRDRSGNGENSYGKMKLGNGGRCGFLDNKNLCLIHGNLGEEYLCNTCKSYPRKIKKNGELYERNLALSCPVVVKSLIEEKIFTFEMEENQISKIEESYIYNKEYNKQLYYLLFEARKLTIEIVQFREIELWKRLTFAILFNEKLQEVISVGDYKHGVRLIDRYKDYYRNENNCRYLEKVPKSDDVSIALTNAILEQRVRKGINNKMFLGLINEFKTLVDEKNIEEDGEGISERACMFNDSFNKYEYVLENYIVCNLYDNYLNALNTKNIKKEIVRLALSYSIIKKLLMTRSNKKKLIIDEKDIVDVIYSFSRVMEHSEQFIDSIYNKIKGMGYDSSAYLTILVR